jgi:proline dehydrogenase
MHPLRDAFLWLSRRQAIGRWLERLPLCQRIVARFVAGRSRTDAVETARPLINDGFAVTFAYLGEEVDDLAEAADAVDEYRLLIATIGDSGLAVHCRVAVKPSLLGLHLDPAVAAAHLGKIATDAQQRGVGIELDMERADTVDGTLALYRSGLTHHPELGIALQAYLRRTADDLDTLIDEGIAHVRLVKGAYSEEPSVALTGASDVKSSYHRLMRRVLDPHLMRRGATAAIATHDQSLIAAARTRAMRQRVPDDAWEVQMLYGVRPQLQQRLLREGYSVRVSLPYGERWYPYFMRRIGERPANLWFAMRQVLGR